MRPVMLSFLLIFGAAAAVADQGMTRAEQISQGLAQITEEEGEAFVEACSAWQKTARPTTYRGVDALLVTFEDPLFIELFDIVRTSSGNQIINYGQYALGGISKLDMCDNQVAVIHPEGTNRRGQPGLIATMAIRFRPDRDLASNYPTAYPEIVAQNAQLRPPSGEYIAIRTETKALDFLRSIHNVDANIYEALTLGAGVDPTAPIMIFRGYVLLKTTGGNG